MPVLLPGQVVSRRCHCHHHCHCHKSNAAGWWLLFAILLVVAVLIKFWYIFLAAALITLLIWWWYRGRKPKADVPVGPFREAVDVDDNVIDLRKRTGTGG